MIAELPPLVRALSWRVAHVIAVALGLALGTVRASAEAQRPSPFASLVERLSESGGDFDSDNLISNEQSYLHVMPALEQARVGGGAYIGVGPEQNFSYISNVEQYLFRDGSWPRYVENLTRLPRNDRSTMIRSVFRSGYRGPLPQSVPGHYSTSLTQPLSAMLADVAANKYRSYADLVLASAR